MYFSQVINNRVNFVSVQREFRPNEGDDDYATIPEVTLAGDFVIEFDLLTDTQNQSTCLALYTSDTSEYIYIQVLSSSKIKISSDGFTPGNGLISVNNGVINKIKVVLSGSQFSVFVNGLIDYSVNHTNPSKLGKTYSVLINAAKQSLPSVPFDYLSGILANLKIYDNGTLVRNYPINDGKNILANVATALGSELDGLTYALTTAIGGVASVVLSSLSVIGKTYLVEVSYSGVVGDASVRIGGFSGPSFTGTGTIEFIATATTAVNDILGALTGVTSGSVTVSIKEAEGYGTVINGNADDWGLFDRQADGDWEGVDVISQPINLNSDWVVTANTVIESVNEFSGSSVGGVYYNTTKVGRSYRLTSDISGDIGDLQIKNSAGLGSGTNIVSDVQLGVAITDFVTDDTGVYLRVSTLSPFTTIVINKLRLKEVLKNA